MNSVHERFATEQIPLPLEHALDVLWEEHQKPLFPASLELWVAARTDPELGRILHKVEREVSERFGELAVPVFGEIGLRPGFRNDLAVVLATIRGLALLGVSDGRDAKALSAYWRHTRSRLMQMLGGDD